MIRAFGFLTLCLVFATSSSCLKKKIEVNRLEGTWTYTKYLVGDGSYQYFSNSTLTFENGKADGKTFLGLTYRNDTTETTGKYLVNKKATQIYLMYDVNLPSKIDTLDIEDMDKKMLIAHDLGGIRFYDKVD